MNEPGYPRSGRATTALTPTVRQHLLTGQLVLLAPERSDREGAFLNGVPEESTPENCPFCPGHENWTPPEICRLGSDLEWRVRVFPNKYPAVDSPHELIVESPDHGGRFHDLPPDHAVEVVNMYVTRFAAACDVGGLEYVSLFKNHGRSAGMTIDHPHSQLVTLSFVPPGVREIEAAFRNGSCPLCELLRNSAGVEANLVGENRNFALLTPSPSEFAYEQWLVPKQHQTSLASITSQERSDLAELLQSSTTAMNSTLGDPAYNFSFRNPSVKLIQNGGEFHWFVEIVPRLTTPGGFELNTGSSINIVTPEQAARNLRRVLVGAGGVES